MKRELVTSSNILELGYDEESRILEVVFHSGNVYQYFDVPPKCMRNSDRLLPLVST